MFYTHENMFSTGALPSEPILPSSISLLTRELAFSMVQMATSSAANPQVAEVLPMYPSTRTPASSNTLYRAKDIRMLYEYVQN